jgi:hypothetical protein
LEICQFVTVSTPVLKSTLYYCLKYSLHQQTNSEKITHNTGHPRQVRNITNIMNVQLTTVLPRLFQVFWDEISEIYIIEN